MNVKLKKQTVVLAFIVSTTIVYILLWCVLVSISANNMSVHKECIGKTKPEPAPRPPQRPGEVLYIRVLKGDNLITHKKSLKGNNLADKGFSTA